MHGESIEVIGNTKERVFLPAIRNAVERKELLSENNEYEIYTVNMDEFVEGLPDDTKLEYDDIDILSFMGKE